MNVDHSILVVGHYSHDTLIGTSGEVARRLGGPPAYVSAILEVLDADYSVVSKVGPDFKYFAEVHAQPTVAQHARTTSCINDYSHAGRRQTVPVACEAISPGDIKTTAGIALACGMVGEILPETVVKLREVSDILVGDLQGFLREIQPDRKVAARRLEATPYADLIPHFDFLKASRAEISYLDLASVRKQTRLIMTDGEKGCVLYGKDKEFSVPGYDVVAKDATGAGDCFLAGFVYGIAEGFDEWRAARLANLCGSLAVEHVGVPRLSKNDVAAIREDLVSGDNGSHQR